MSRQATLSFVSPPSLPRATSRGNLVFASSIYHNSNVISRPICFNPIEKTSLEYRTLDRTGARDKPKKTFRVFTSRLSPSSFFERRKKWQVASRFEIKISLYSLVPGIRSALFWSLDFKVDELPLNLLSIQCYVPKERSWLESFRNEKKEGRWQGTSLWGYLRNSFRRLLTIDVCSREIGLRNIAKFGFQIVIVEFWKNLYLLCSFVNISCLNNVFDVKFLVSTFFFLVFYGNSYFRSKFKVYFSLFLHKCLKCNHNDV